jgi:hypothetical protein
LEEHHPAKTNRALKLPLSNRHLPDQRQPQATLSKSSISDVSTASRCSSPDSDDADDHPSDAAHYAFDGDLLFDGDVDSIQPSDCTSGPDDDPDDPGENRELCVFASPSEPHEHEPFDDQTKHSDHAACFCSGACYSFSDAP